MLANETTSDFSLRFLAMLQPSFLQLSSLRIDKRNLLKAQMKVATNDDHTASFS
jgi:hypothetical protein